jgi:Cu/Ag efflux protein CusF
MSNLNSARLAGAARCRLITMMLPPFIGMRFHANNNPGKSVCVVHSSGVYGNADACHEYIETTTSFGSLFQKENIMKRSSIAFVLATTLFAGSAFAADVAHTGQIHDVDADAGKITLIENSVKTEYEADDEKALEGLNPGDEVTLTVNGEGMVSAAKKI